MTGAELKAIRNGLKLNQGEMGERIGFSRQTIAEWERADEVQRVVALAVLMLCVERSWPDIVSHVSGLNAVLKPHKT